MRKRSIALLLALTASAQAGSISGNDFIGLQEDHQISYVVGVLDGVSLTAQSGNGPFKLCLPSNVTSRQLAAVSKNYVLDHPETLRDKASGSIIVALKTAFPCK